MRLTFVIALLVIVSATAAVAAENRGIPWNIEALSSAPKTYPAPQHDTELVKAIFYQGETWKGDETRVFAYYGLPKNKGAGKVPAMVLVHGGGGSAFIPWVELWVRRGYAAIAMDTCGCISSDDYKKKHIHHDKGGPQGWGGFGKVNAPVKDQWLYHAVADVILANSLIRTFPEVDAEKIGVTGVSWGGVIACIAASVDDRFKFAAPVYGCGFLGHDSMWLDEFKNIGDDNARRWLGLWDPSVYLPRTKIPFLWVDGTNDLAFPMDSLQMSYRLPKTPRTISTRLRMPHAHGGPGEGPEEIFAMAEALFRDKMPLARITGQGINGRTAWVKVDCRCPIVKTELNYTLDTGKWSDRKWRTAAAQFDEGTKTVSATIPEMTAVYFFNVVDARGLIVSSEHETIRRNPATTAGNAVFKREFIFGDNAPFPQCHASTLADTGEGLAAAWFGGSQEGNSDVCIWVASDRGSGWSKPIAVANGKTDDGKLHPCWNPVFFKPKNGPLLLFYKIGPSPAAWWGMLLRSTDNGRTWSAPERLPNGMIGPDKNKPTLLAENRLLCGSSTENPDWQVHVEWTSDLGRNWARQDLTSENGKIWAIQPTILNHGHGELQMLCRTNTGRIAESRSNDGGRSWCKLTMTDLPNPNSGFDAITLQDGRHLLVYNPTTVLEGNEPGLRSPLIAAVSRDGRAWDEAVTLEERLPEMPKAEFSYPAVIQAADGLVHITYTWKRVRIAHVVIDPRRLQARPER